MPSWIVSLLLAVIVGLILFAVGGSDVVIILVVMFAWFVVLAGLALAAETGIQAFSRLVRRER